MKTKKTIYVIAAIMLLALALSACDAQAGFNAGNDGSSSNAEVNNLSANDDDMNDSSNNDLNDDSADDINDDNNNDLEDSNDDNMNDDSSNDMYDNESESEDITLKGVVESVEGNTITINGETFEIDPSLLPEGMTAADLLQAGDSVEIEFVVNADGSITIIKFEFEDVSGDGSDDDSSDDNLNNNDDSSDDNMNNDDDNNNYNNDDSNDDSSNDDMSDDNEEDNS